MNVIKSNRVTRILVKLINPRVIKWFWRIYLLITVLLCLILLKDYLAIFPNFSFRNFIDFITLPVYPLAIYLYMSKKKMFSYFVWKIIFWFILIDMVLTVIYMITPLSKNYIFSLFYMSNLSDYALNPNGDLVFCICYLIVIVPFILLSIPQFYAIYRLGYPKKEKVVK